MLGNTEENLYLCSMKKLISNIFVIILSVFGTISLYARTEFRIVQYTTVDGLVNNTVRHIMQDSKGRLWISTSNGISIFDGHSFRNIRQQRDTEEPGLPDHRIRRTYEKEGYVWIETPSGMACYDISKEDFIDYRKKRKPVPAFPDEEKRILFDERGREWKATMSDGLYITDPITGETEHFTTNTLQNKFPTNELKCIFRDKKGYIWIGTNNIGLSKLKVIDNHGASFMLEGQNIRMVKRLRNGSIAIANKKGDVHIYDATLNNLLRTVSYDHNTYSVYLDADSTRWQATKGGGLLRNGERMEEVTADEVYDVMRDTGHRLWVGTFGEGLYHEGRYFLDDNERSKMVRRIIEDRGNRMWVATSNGVFVFNPEQLLRNGSFICHMNSENGMLWNDEVRTVFCDSKGNTYIAEAGEGFAYVDGKVELSHASIRHYTTADSLVNDMVQCFVEDSEGYIWIATELGVSRFTPATGRMKSYFFSENSLSNVYGENCGILLDDGRIAFGTNNGLLIIDPSIYNKEEKATEITVQDLSVDGAQKEGDVTYVLSQWWKTPWVWILILLIISISAYFYYRSRRHAMRMNKTMKQMWERREELLKESQKVKERYSTDVVIRRQEKKSEEEKEFIERMAEIAKREMSNPDFSAEDFARLMGMGRTAFYSKTKRILGYSPIEYIKTKRMTHAAELIATTSMTLSQIALRIGITDSLYFSRVFKQTYGMAPSKWREENSHKG